jgi:FAD:protein FMN transferase
VEPVLGSRLSLLPDVDTDDDARAAEEAVVREADRLEAILSLHRPQSPFSRWRRRELRRPPPEVVAVLRTAAEWFERTSGAFNPCLGAVMRRWRRAELEQRAPEPAELRALAQVGQVLPFEVVADDVVAVGDCETVDVQAVAKGWVVDQLIAAALAISGVRSVLVDVGGDVRHAGAASALVALEDPFRVADNAPPAAVVRLADGALATSGGVVGAGGSRVAGTGT